MDSNQKRKGWFDLPAEIRSTIYRELLTHPKLLGVYVLDDGKLSTVLDQSLGVSILRTNKRVHAEATGILYGDNVIRLPYWPPSLQKFFQTIGVCNQSLVTRVAIHGHHVASYFKSERILPTHPISLVVEHCPHLKEVVFQTCCFATPGRRRTFMELHSHLANISSLERVVIQMPPDLYRVYTTPTRFSNELDVAGLMGGIDQLGWVLEITDRLG
ncbi:hypothetical protein PG996_001383 [Apiospora saccharicola]|uniref:F-box domain-containing protein n=1 Tax=Apiospora saccharicola TaxID=335842 RepID=A0ABR1WGK1_9PEZI